MLQYFPIVGILGPRQSGKTTFSKALCPEYQYVNFELPATRQMAEQDPLAFLERYKGGVILDEIQHVPHLFSYLQVLTDERKINGEYLLTGSQHFLMIEKITQSLAGRIALLTLLPLSGSEFSSGDIDQTILKGGYPGLYQKKLNPYDFFQSYIATYIERDVRQIINVQNLSQFQRFLLLLAGRAGQVLNVSSLANDTGISPKTAESWLSVLEASFVVFRLYPYYKNFNKRITKSPKLYFYDTGLLCHLLNIRDIDQFNTHFATGAIVENGVLLELMKFEYNRGKTPHFYYWRDSNSNELDLIIEDGLKLKAVEIKSSRTFNQDFYKGLHYFKNLVPDAKLYCVYRGETQGIHAGVNLFNVKDVIKIME